MYPFLFSLHSIVKSQYIKTLTFHLSLLLNTLLLIIPLLHYAYSFFHCFINVGLSVCCSVGRNVL